MVAPRTPSPTNRSTAVPPTVAEARKWLGRTQMSGQCLAWVSTVAGTKGRGQTVGTATESWQQAQRNGNLHTSSPPVGAPVFWAGGSTGAGHTAIVSKYVNGKPYVISTGINGQVKEVPLSYFSGLRYKGWASAINNIKLDTSKFIQAGGSPPPIDMSSGGGESVTTVTNTVTDGGSWSVAGPGYSKKEMYDYLSASFGDVDSMLALDKALPKEKGQKSLKWAIDTLVKKKIVDPNIAVTYLNQTAFFKKYGTTVAKRLVEEKQKPEVAGRDIDAAKQAILASTAERGITLPQEELNRISRDAWVYGWTSDQINAQVAAAKGAVLNGGQWSDAVAEAQTFADDHGMVLSEAQLRKLQDDFLNARGSQGIQDQIREQAANTYPMFADRIKAGESLRTVTDAYFRMASDLLEVDQNTIEWSDSLFRNGKAFTTTDPATGQPAVKNLADFEKDIKADARWVNTKNAKEDLTNGAYTLLQRFGAVA